MTHEPNPRRRRRRKAAVAVGVAVAVAALWWPHTADTAPDAPKAQLTVGGPKIGTAVRVEPDGRLVELGGTAAPAVAALVVAVGSLAFAATKPRHPTVAVWELERAELCDRYEAQLACLRENWELAERTVHLLWSVVDDGGVLS